MTSKVQYYIIAFLVFVLALGSCMEQAWNDHYKDNPPTSNTSLWQAISNTNDFPEYSSFVGWVKATGYDSAFMNSQSHTLFIPTNSAIANFDTVGKNMKVVVGQLISETLFVPSNLKTWRKLLMMNGKFSLIERKIEEMYFNNIRVEKRSPLYKDGVFFELSAVPVPMLNLYEYLSISSPVIRDYIDGLDSLVFNPNLATPIDFDAKGNTIYDSSRVTGKGFVFYNSFFDNYFSVDREFRDQSATLLIFNQEQYNSALNIMADNLGSSFPDYRSIPQNWQKQILLPYYMNRAVFDSIFTDAKFDTSLTIAKYKNIQGDSVEINPSNIDLSSRYECSNGVVYNFKNFVIPEKLYNDTLIQEGEDLVTDLGASRFAWNVEVAVSNASYEPIIDASDINASKSRQLVVNFPSQFSGPYTLEFKIDKVFPRKYKLLWQASNRPSGKVTWYVKDNSPDAEFVKVGTYDNDTWGSLTPYVKLTGELTGPKNGRDALGYSYNGSGWRLSKNKSMNYVEFILDDVIKTYGEVTIKCEWVKGQNSSFRGLIIDAVMLIPYN
jgi:hypothetical protein